MALRMFRYEIPVDGEAHKFLLKSYPVKAEITPSFQVEFWAEHNDVLDEEEYTFQVYGTGHPIPDGGMYVATTDRKNGLVFHLYELPEE